MAQFISGGIDGFRALAYSAPSQHVMDQIRSIGSLDASRLTQRAAEQFNVMRQRIQTFDMEAAKRKVQGAMRKLENIWMYDVIQEISEVSQMQHAPNCMIRYIMAEPTVRYEYHNGRCEGYGERYTDNYPGRIKEDDPVYKKVMDGIWYANEEGNLEFTEYWWDEEVDNEPDLTFAEQVNIVHTWDHIRAMISNRNDDPTSPYNAKL